MSATDVSVPRRPPQSSRRRWLRRLGPPLLAVTVGWGAFAFAVALVVDRPTHRASAASRQVPRSSGAGTAPSTAPSPAAHGWSFPTVYPPDPVTPERPKVEGSTPAVPSPNVVRFGRVESMWTLHWLLPPGVLTQLSSGAWLLARPAAVEGPAEVTLSGPGSLLIAPGAFLEVRKAGALSIQGFRISAVDAHDRPLAQPTPVRGFLMATEGGRLVLVSDVISDLGHLGDMSYGIALRQPGPGSEITRCTITGNYFGVYTSHGVGVRIVGNHVSSSVVYGIDPQIESRDVLVKGNVVRDSGIHGIILSARDHGIRVLDNVVQGARLHGIVLYRGSDGNVIRWNSVTGTFDGIVITDSSGNLVQGNTVAGAKRFGLRVSGASRGNRIVSDAFLGNLVGAYLYGGATGNAILHDRFAGNLGNLRIRRDAHGNTVLPIPGRSDIGD